MTPIQRTAVKQLQSEGFEIILEAREVVRLSKGADKRLVQQDGTQKRANHVDLRKERF